MANEHDNLILTALQTYSSHQHPKSQDGFAGTTVLKGAEILAGKEMQSGEVYARLREMAQQGLVVRTEDYKKSGGSQGPMCIAAQGNAGSPYVSTSSSGYRLAPQGEQELAKQQTPIDASSLHLRVKECTECSPRASAKASQVPLVTGSTPVRDAGLGRSAR